IRAIAARLAGNDVRVVVANGNHVKIKGSVSARALALDRQPDLVRGSGLADAGGSEVLEPFAFQEVDEAAASALAARMGNFQFRELITDLLGSRGQSGTRDQQSLGLTQQVRVRTIAWLVE